ncbi:MAG: hypothetical protein JST33_16915 [Actinobacteria bacterium]|nr:hypothetical protein [Actinomycetota bacterium]
MSRTAETPLERDTGRPAGSWRLRSDAWEFHRFAVKRIAVEGNPGDALASDGEIRRALRALETIELYWAGFGQRYVQQIGELLAQGDARTVVGIPGHRDGKRRPVELLSAKSISRVGGSWLGDGKGRRQVVWSGETHLRRGGRAPLPAILMPAVASPQPAGVASRRCFGGSPQSPSPRVVSDLP